IFPATDGVRDILACDRHSIYRFNPDWSGELVYQSGGNLDWGAIASELQQQQGWIYANQEILVVHDLERMGFPPAQVKFWRSYGVKAFVHVPIMAGQKLWGILTVYQHQPRQWQEREVRLVSQVADQIGVAIQQADLLIQEQKAAEIASAAEQAMSQFLTLMSHELRTPLNSILGFAQLLSLDKSLSEAQLENLGIIYRSGAHLLTLINDVLEMSKIEAGQEQLYFEQFEIQGLLTSLREMLGLKAKNKGVELSCSCDVNVPPLVKADQQKLRQVLINLLGNGIKFTDQGRVSLWVSLTPDHRLSFRVEDTGCGIPANQIESIFEPFIQSEAGRAQEGTGLGLTISKKFVQLMGGELVVTSIVGQGSCFEFAIAFDVAESPTPVNLPVPTKLLLLPHQAVPRILVAEDDPDTRDLMVTTMANLGFITQTVVDGDQAIAQWQAWQPDLIWLDLGMPRVSGTEVTSYIRQQERVQQIPLGKAVKIIGITSSLLASDRDQLLAAGCDHFITKPFDLGLMFAKVRECLNLSYDYGQTTVAPPVKNYSEIEHQSQQMPSLWHQQLKFAAKAADEEAIATLVEQVPAEFAALISFLNQSVNDFRLHQISHLLK
ncbi:MAG: ATP-binding protein, partial [Pseudanabaenaceae cyanobacterium bins.68]|nr:ATP-binding protein [Pseudanabaenaceae cyanobacterium bins.68]